MPTRVPTAADLAERLQVPVSYLGSLCRRLGIPYDGPQTPLPGHAEALVRTLMDAGLDDLGARRDPYIDPRLVPSVPVEPGEGPWPAWSVRPAPAPSTAPAAAPPGAMTPRRTSTGSARSFGVVAAVIGLTVAVAMLAIPAARARPQPDAVVVPTSAVGCCTGAVR